MVAGESDVHTIEIAKLLLKYGADPNFEHPHSAIYYAKIYKQAIVPLLLMSCVEYDGNYTQDIILKKYNILVNKIELLNAKN